MRVYYDFEFLEDGRTLDPISLGMLRADGEEYYAVNADVDWESVLNHPWLPGNVVPHLPVLDGIHLDRKHPDVKPRSQIAQEVHDFLLDAITVECGDIVDEIELWSWYASYDFVALAQLFGPLMDRPFFMPMYTNDIRQEFQRFGNPRHNVPNGDHNALADAHYHKKLHDFILQIERDRFKTALDDVADSIGD